MIQNEAANERPAVAKPEANDVLHLNAVTLYVMAANAATVPKVPLTAWIGKVFLAWLLPGSGHFLLGRPVRGALIALSVVAMFVMGLMMRGAMFEPQTGDLLTTLIYYGGFVGNLASGSLYMLAMALGYNQPDVAGHVHDYGTKFLVAAGLLNVLAMVDTHEIATGKKS
jgi:hypothetical protein